MVLKAGGGRGRVNGGWVERRGRPGRRRRHVAVQAEVRRDNRRADRQNGNHNADDGGELGGLRFRIRLCGSGNMKRDPVAT